jgi:hypothetical protein
MGEEEKAKGTNEVGVELRVVGMNDSVWRRVLRLIAGVVRCELSRLRNSTSQLVRLCVVRHLRLDDVNFGCTATNADVGTGVLLAGSFAGASAAS